MQESISPKGEAAEAAARPLMTLHDQPPVEDEAVLRAVPDLRGLEVEDSSGLCVGSLFGALAEAETGLVRYVDLELGTLDRHVLVPIGHARVRQPENEDPVFRLRAALLEELEQIPPFPADVTHIDDPFERALLEAYGRTFHGERYYAHPAYDHHGIYVGDHPVVAHEESAERPPLSRLSYLPGWRVAQDEPDIRDWPLVLEGDGTRVAISDLVIDPGAKKVRYVVVPTADDSGARLLPIGYVQVSEQAHQVCAPGLTAEDLAELPRYDGGGVTRDMEDSVFAAMRRRLSGPRRYLLADYRLDQAR